MSRTIFHKITSSLWVLISFIPLFNGLGFIYIGNKHANTKWFVEGILYELPHILGLMTMPNIGLATSFFILGSILSFVSIIRSIMVDFTLQKQLDQSHVVEKDFSAKIDDVIDSLWVLISFIPLFNGVGLIYKGKTTPKKSWYMEGILYEIPWIIGILGLSVQPIRFVAFEAALAFYFVSIIRSIMVATEPKSLYARRSNPFSQETKFEHKKEEKVEKTEKQEEKTEKVNVDIQEGVIPAFKFYEKQFDELAEIYPQKEKNALDLIEQRFAPPQLTYSRFKRVVDDSHDTFYSQLSAGQKILDLSTEYSPKVEDELKNKVVVLNSIIQGLDKLSEELILNISQIESESDDELNQLFEEFSRVTGSVRAYE